MASTFLARLAEVRVADQHQVRESSALRVAAELRHESGKFAARGGSIVVGRTYDYRSPAAKWILELVQAFRARGVGPDDGTAQES